MEPDEKRLLQAIHREVGEIKQELRDFKQVTETAFKDISKREQKNREDFQEYQKKVDRIEQRCEGRETHCPVLDETLEKAIEDIKGSALSKTTKYQILTNTVLSALNLVLNAALQWKYGIGIVAALVAYLSTLYH